MPKTLNRDEVATVRAIRAEEDSARIRKRKRVRYPKTAEEIARTLVHYKRRPAEFVRELAFGLRRLCRAEGEYPKLVRKRIPGALRAYYLELPLEGDCSTLSVSGSHPNWGLARIFARGLQAIGQACGEYFWDIRYFPSPYKAPQRIRYFHGVRKSRAFDDYETGSENDAHYMPPKYDNSIEGVQDAHSDLSGGQFPMPRAGAYRRSSGYLELVGDERSQFGRADHGHAGQELEYVRIYLLAVRADSEVYAKYLQRRSRILGATTI